MIYMHGGFENETPNIPTNSIMKIDLSELLKGHANLMQKLESLMGNSQKHQSKSDRSGKSAESEG